MNEIHFEVDYVELGSSYAGNNDPDKKALVKLSKNKENPLNSMQLDGFNLREKASEYGKKIGIFHFSNENFADDHNAILDFSQGDEKSLGFFKNMIRKFGSQESLDELNNYFFETRQSVLALLVTKDCDSNCLKVSTREGRRNVGVVLIDYENDAVRHSLRYMPDSYSMERLNLLIQEWGNWINDDSWEMKILTEDEELYPIQSFYSMNGALSFLSSPLLRTINDHNSNFLKFSSEPRLVQREDLTPSFPAP